MHIVLFQPQIPQNTGNIIRLCANSGSTLHLIQPYGFHWSERSLRRSGLDYHQWVDVQHHLNFSAFQQSFSGRIIACSVKATKIYTEEQYQPSDALLFGSETQGLDSQAWEKSDQYVRIPMIAGQRCLNLANSVGIILYESLRQMNFTNMK